MMKRLCIGVTLLFLAPSIAFSLTLDEGLKIVAEKGRDVRIAGAVEDQAREDVALARSPLFPRVDLFASHTDLKSQPEAVFGPLTAPTAQKDFNSYGFTVNQTIYDFGKTTSTLRASKYGLKAKEVDTFRTKNDAALEFIVAYLDLLESEKLVQVSHDEVDALKAHVSDTEALFSEGMITRNDVLQANVTLSDSQQRLLTAENAREIRASRVNSLLLRPLNEEVKAEEVSVGALPEVTLEDSWRMAEAERPELKEADAGIAAKQEEVKAVRAEYLPNIFVTGGYNYEENRYMTPDENWSVVAGVNLNIFAGGATSAKVGKAKAEEMALKLSRDKLLDRVMIEVKSAYLDLQSARQKLDVAQQAVEQAEENLRLVRLRYQEGVGTATDVLDAVTLKTRADTNYWDGVYGVRRAEARLQYAIGKDLVKAYTQTTDETQPVKSN